MQVTFGAHKGKDVSELPLDYVMWGVDNLKHEAMLEAFVAELEKRTGAGKDDYATNEIGKHELIYGKDDTKGVVNVTVENDKVYLYNTDGSHEVHDYYPWVLSNQPSAKREAEKLKGNQYYKYKTRITTQDFIDMSRERVRGVWLARGIEECFMLEHGVTYFKGMQPQHLSLLSFDIEATGLDPEEKNAEVILISYTYRSKDQKYQRKMYDIFDYKDQQEMIKQFCKDVNALNPDVMLGHNILGYDLPYLNKQQSLQLGRNDGFISFDEKVSKKRKDGSQSYDFHNAKVHGREIVDTMFMSITYDSARDFPSYGLKQIEEHLGLADDNRIVWDFEKNKTRDYKSWSKELWSQFKQYCADDTDSPIKMFDIMIPSLFYLNQSIPKTLQQMVNEATGSQIDAIMIRAYLQEGYSQPKTSSKVDFEGAISMGIPGIYKDVRKVDVASLYPSIMLEKNIYDKKKDPKRYMLQMLEYFRDERLKNKALAAETGERYYDDLQGAQKIVINSMYGFMGAGYLLYNFPKGAALVTERGREILQIGVRWACGFELEKVIKSIKNKGKSNEEIKYHWVPGEKTSEGLGFILVNVDTDSFSITDNTIPTKEEFAAQIKELNKLYDKYIVWEDDSVFDKFIVFKAKNYVMQKNKNWCKPKELNEDGTAKVKYKGSSLTDQKKEPILIKMLKEQIQHILDERPIHAMVETYDKLCKQALKPADIKNWCVKKTVTKSVLRPERANEQKPLDACNEAIAKGIINGIQEGDKIYLYQATAGEKQALKKGEPIFLKDGSPKMIPKTALRFPELYNNDHDAWHYVGRVHSTQVILENVVDIKKFTKYNLKGKRALLDENV